MRPSLPPRSVRFAVSFPAERSAKPLDGRLLLLISKDPSKEPRFQIQTGPKTQVVFGIDVDGLAPGKDAIFDASAIGYPIDSLREIPKGRYRVQGLLHRYETFHRKDGHVVKLPMDRGEGQQWNLAPGNLYSEPVEMEIDPAKGGTLRVTLDKEIPPIPDPPETKYIKHVKIQSKLLTEFWGRPMHLGAHVLLPEGFDEHPEARYPLMIYHGHFPYTMSGFREEPPDPNLKPEYSERFHWEGYNRTEQEHAYQLYKDWTGPGFPRVLAIEIQHANPYYDDSYAVNSENLGPYGDAITYELIPEIEKRFRGIGQGWARFLYGGSTGGWEALGVQVFYPDEYNGCFAACPDPIDFRAYTVVDIYEDKNAYYLDSDWKKTPRPGLRDYLGHVSGTSVELNRMELVARDEDALGPAVGHLGSGLLARRGRRLPEAHLGQGDRSHRQEGRRVLAGELRPLLHPEARLGEARPEARGEDPHLRRRHGQFLPEQRRLPHRGVPREHEEPLLRRRGRLRRPGGALLERRSHGPNATSRLRYHQMFIPRAVERMLKTAPAGADLKSWRY